MYFSVSRFPIEMNMKDNLSEEVEKDEFNYISVRGFCFSCKKEILSPARACVINY